MILHPQHLPAYSSLRLTCLCQNAPAEVNSLLALNKLACFFLNSPFINSASAKASGAANLQSKQSLYLCVHISGLLSIARCIGVELSAETWVSVKLIGLDSKLLKNVVAFLLSQIE